MPADKYFIPSNCDRKILFLGSGFVAGPCLDLLLKRPENKVTIACRHLSTAQALSSHSQATAISLDANNQAALEAEVEKHDLVISLIPYTLHAKVGHSCLILGYRCSSQIQETRCHHFVHLSCHAGVRPGR